VISDEDARQAGYSFNFTPAQWADICNSVESSGGMLARFPAGDLLLAANLYLRREAEYRPPSKAAKAWGAVAKWLRGARRAIAEIEDPLDPCLYVYTSSFDRSAGELRREIESAERCSVETALHLARIYADPAGPWEFLSVMGLLERWEEEALDQQELQPPRELPRTSFYNAVLTCLSKAGGKITFSRNPRTGGGPCVRYVIAVCAPVMGTYAPKPEGIRTHIERWKKMG
jgi:hypothetical protein